MSGGGWGRGWETCLLTSSGITEGFLVPSQINGCWNRPGDTTVCRTGPSVSQSYPSSTPNTVGVGRDPVE